MTPHAIFILAFLAVIIFGGGYAIPRYAGISRGTALLVFFGSVVVGGFVFVQRMQAIRHYAPGTDVILRQLACAVFIIFAAALAMRLWGRWLGDCATAEERLPGKAGIQAWLSGSNITVCAALVLTAWFGYDVSPFLGLVIVAALLLAYPVIRTESPSLSAAPATAREDLSAEREKIISMLEAGRLTPEESAELLHALGESSSRSVPPPPAPLTGGQRLMLIGAALVLVGFFLPWFVINPGKELGRLAQQIERMPQMDLAMLGGGNLKMPSSGPLAGMQFQTSYVTFSGGDIQRGLGWAALFLALTAAMIPYVATRTDPATVRTIRLLCLGAGSLIVLYLLTQMHVRFIGAGLIIAVSGYALEFVGALRERRAALL